MNPTQFRNGTVIDIDGTPAQIIEFASVDGGMRTKIKNIRTGQVSEKIFALTDNIDSVYLERVELELSDRNGDLCTFCNTQTFDFIEFDTSYAPEDFKYVKPGNSCSCIFYNGKIINVESPSKAYLDVVDVTVVAGKPIATLELGLKIDVPSYVKVGSSVCVNLLSKTFMYEV